jgi:prepilin-type N-terminal cleavage/methylation domain-containing protein
VRIYRNTAGFTMVELLIVVGIIGIIAAISAPGLIRARLTANESAAVASMRVISSAESNYASTCGAGGYATELSDLVKPPPASVHGFLSPDLGFNGVQKSGYLLSVVKNAAADTVDVLLDSCNDADEPRASSFFASAIPARPGETGDRRFATDTPGTIYMDAADIPNPIPGTVSVLK